MTMSDNKPFEIRDPVLGFISLDETEQQVIDSRAMQRLKHIHQLAMTYQVYPGATHKRFEHSLGVMELAGRAFDVLTDPVNLTSEVRDAFPDLFRARQGREKLGYWRRVVRLGALCHDIGHLPFSHAVEEELLPPGMNHEDLSGRLITEDAELAGIWESSVGPINGEHVLKLALGPDKCERIGVNLTDWERLLAGIVVDDTLGVDRMDYLIRDSYHLGVAYGRFDVDRLVQSLRFLPWADPPDAGTVGEFGLGINHGGLHAAEGLLLARYFMFMQVYYHHARLAYDLHLADFMKAWLPTVSSAKTGRPLFEMTDNEVLTAIAEHAEDVRSPCHVPAKRIQERRHYKRIKVAEPTDLSDSDLATFERLGIDCEQEFPGESALKMVKVSRPGRDISVRLWSGRIVRLSEASEASVTDSSDSGASATRGYIFINRDREQEALAWLKAQMDTDPDPAIHGG